MCLGSADRNLAKTAAFICCLNAVVEVEPVVIANGMLLCGGAASGAAWTRTNESSLWDLVAHRDNRCGILSR